MGRKPAKLPTGVRRHGSGYSIWWLDASGKRRWRAAGADAREAGRLREELARNARRARAGLEDEIRQEVLLQDLRTEYLVHLRTDCKPRWVRDVGSGLARMLDLLPTERVSGIRKQDLEQARLSIVEEGRAHRTANKLAGFVLAMLRWAEETNRIARNPIPQLRKLDTSGAFQTKIRYRLSVDEARRLQVAADNLRVGGRKNAGSPIGDLVALILGTGLRIQEALSLQWCHVGPESITITAANEKSSRGRTIPLAAHIVRRLSDRRASAGRLLDRLPTASDYVFLSPRTGAPLCRSSGGGRALGWLHRALEAAGIDRMQPDGSSIDWHALRHTFCCILIERGAATHAVQALLGHATPALTMQIYADLNRAPKRQAIDLLPDLEGGEDVRPQPKDSSGA